MQEKSAPPNWKSLFRVRRQELPMALSMFGYIFLVITTFWILKPIKKGLFIGFYDASGFSLLGWEFTASQAELIAKVLNMVVAAAAVVVFSWLSNRWVRDQLTRIFSAFFIAGFLLFAWWAQHPEGASVWTFYLFGDLYSTLMVATFFAFLNDAVKPEAARRLYGLIVLGAVAGGAFGANMVAVWTELVSFELWMFVCVGVALVIAVLATYAGRAGARLAQRNEADAKSEPPSAELDAARQPTEPAPAPDPAKPAEPPANPALAGARLVFRSSYLLAIVGIVGVYEIVSTILDFQFTATVAHYTDGQALKQQFATVYAITAGVSLLVQLFATSFVMNRFRLTVALLVAPAAMLTGSFAFLALPLLWPGSLLNTWDNALNYSINQSAREALYTPTTRDEKYKAKAFIDMFVQRFAKALAVGVALGITLVFDSFESVRWLSLIAIGLIAVWVVAARYAGRRFHQMVDTGR